jgi:hypothetical protein
MSVCEDAIPVPVPSRKPQARIVQLATPASAISETLDLSESRAYDAALDITGAYKLTGNFTLDLELVLKDLDVLDKMAFEIKPKAPLSDHRPVEFRPLAPLDERSFRAITRIVERRIGAAPSWWYRLMRQSPSIKVSSWIVASATRSPS